MSTPKKRLKLGEAMRVDQPSTPSKDQPPEVTENLQKRGTILHWELEDIKSRYKELTGQDFAAGEREVEGPKHDVKRLQHNFTAHYVRIPKQVDEKSLRPLDKACTGCGVRSQSGFSETKTICKKDLNSPTSYVSTVCTGIPQLKNQCGPVWTPGIILYGCIRCKMFRLGRNDIDNSPPPLSTQEGGFSKFQDLSQIDLKRLLGEAETGAVLARVMNFSIRHEKVLGNILIKYHRNDARLNTSTGLSQLVNLAVRRNTQFNRGSNDFKVDLVYLDERYTPWAPEFEGWTSTAACEYNNFCLSDILITPRLNAMPGQGIKTIVENLSFTMNQKFQYISLPGLKFHLAKRGASMQWIPATDGKMWNNKTWTHSKDSRGEIYLEGVELKDGIYVYVGSTGGKRFHQKEQTTALVEHKAAHPFAKTFKTTLFYPENMDELRLHESQFMIVFLLAELHDCSFKHFTLPFPDTLENYQWPDLKFGTDSIDKPIKVVNNNVTGKNYTIDQLAQIHNFSSVLLKWKAEIDYDWEKDQLKYVKPPSKACTIM